MTENTDAGQNWDDELKDLVDGMFNDASSDAPEDVVDLPATESPASGEQDATPVDKDIAELLAERTLDLQRLQAEYINYKRRVDRDRDLARQRGIEAVLVDLLPVLDGIEAARSHGELIGGAAMLADEVAKVAGKYGLVSFGEEAEPFDPHHHEALMHIDKPGYPVQSVAQVFQKGYSIGDRVIRPARVGVADADPSLAPADPSVVPGDQSVVPGGESDVPSAAANPDTSAGDPGVSPTGDPGASDVSAGEPGASPTGEPGVSADEGNGQTQGPETQTDQE